MFLFSKSSESSDSDSFRFTPTVTPFGSLLARYNAIFNFFRPFLGYYSTYFSPPKSPPIVTANVPASEAAALQAKASVTSFSVSDTAANVAAAFDQLNSDTKLSDITLTTSVPLSITATQFATDTFAEGKLPSGTHYALSGVSVSGASAIQANASVVSFSINDTVANILTAPGLSRNSKLTVVAVADTAADILASLPAVASLPRLSALTLTGGTTLAVTAAQYVSYATTLDLLAPVDRLTVSGAAVSTAATLQSDTHVGSFTITDTASDILGSLPNLNADTKLASVTLTGGTSISVTSAQYFSDRVLLDKLVPGDTVTVSGVSTANLAPVAADNHVGSFSITDTLGNIGSYLNTLETYAKTGELTAITVTDTGQTLVLSPAQYTADADAIALMKGSFTITQAAPQTHLTINIIWDSSTANAPAAWKSDVQYAVNYFESLITTPVTINLRVGYGEAGGYSMGNGTLGEEVGAAATYITANQFKSDLQNSVTSDSTLQSALANLSGGSNPVYITGAQEKAFGLLAANGAEVDASVGFATDPNQTLFDYATTNPAAPGQYDFIGVVEHEISHALGRVSYVGSTTALDLFRYSAPGVLAAAGTNSYFSIDGGVTNLNNFTSSGDTGDWAASAGADANDAYAPSNSVNVFSAADIAELNVLGFSLSTTPPSAVSGVSASLSKPSGSNSLASAANGLNAPTLSFIGTPSVESFTASVTSLAMSLPPAAGIEEIAGLRFGLDRLTIDLSGISGTLKAFDTQVNGAQAIALAGSGDLSHGVVLTGLTQGETAGALLAHHLTVSGSLATIA